jgi:hypothetical protein
MDGLFCGRFSCWSGFSFCELLFIDSSLSVNFGFVMLLVCLKSPSIMSQMWSWGMDEEGYVHTQNHNRFQNKMERSRVWGW